jgi:hypothetical protein
VSTRPVAPDQLSDGWERINPIAIRMDAPGGWIYDIVNSGPVFVPHPVNAARLTKAALNARSRMMSDSTRAGGRSSFIHAG